jgi:hypothetical protein
MVGVYLFFKVVGALLYVAAALAAAMILAALVVPALLYLLGREVVRGLRA